MTWSDSVTLTVELSTDSFDTASPTWSDISAYVRELDTTRGRNNQLERIGPGTCRIVLANADRRFEPGFGTYSGLGPMNRIRVRATYSGTTYDVFYGFVDGWPQDYAPSNTDATCTIQVTDLFGYLANVNIESPWYAALLDASPTYWYRFNDDDGSSVARESLHGAHGSYSPSGVTYGEPSLIPSSEGAIGLASGGYVFLTGAQTGMGSNTAYSVAVVFKRDPVPSGEESIVGWESGNSSLTLDFGWSIRVNANGEALYQQRAGPSSFEITSGVNVCDGQPHVVVVVRNGTTSAHLWVDGVDVASTVPTFATTFAGSTAAKLAVGYSGIDTYTAQFTGTVDDVVFWSSTISDATVEDVSAAALGYDGDDAATRIQRFLDRVGFTGSSDLESGEPRCGDQTSGGSALSLLQTVDATEQGRFFMSADGTATLHNRSHNITASRSTTVQCTFSDDAAALAATGATDCPIFAGAMRFTQDKTQAINSVTVSSPALSAPVTVTDATSIGTYGEQARSITTVSRSTDDARSVGEFLVLKYATPELRCDAWTVKPMSKPVCIPTLLGFEIGDLAQVERTPQGTGSQKQVKMYVERIEHRFTPGDWSVTFSGVPAEPEASTTYWQLGSGALGSTTRLFV